MTTLSRPDPPTVDARRVGVHLVFDCPYCKREHRHGVCLSRRGCKAPTSPFGEVPCTCPRGSGDGHRSAHCHNPASPYNDGGYILREVP